MVEEPTEELETPALPVGEGIMGLPGKFASFRNGQAGVVAKIYGSYAEGKRFVVADMPTGTGKTFIAMVVRQQLDVKSLYVCTTKSLQDQFLKDFPYAKLIKGRNNYACGRVPHKWPDMTAEDCIGERCVMECPYGIAKEEAQKSALVVMNMAYYMSAIQYGGKAFLNRGYVVVDEADTLEDALLEMVSVQISTIDVDKYDLGSPNWITKFEDWRQWAQKAYGKIRLQLQMVEADLRQYDHENNWSTTPIGLVRQRRQLDRMAGKLGFFLKNVDENWVWERTAPGGGLFKNERGSYRHAPMEKWVFKPIRVDQFGDIIFNAAEKFLFMSATILNTMQYEKNVGLFKYRQEGLVDYFSLPSSFDKRRRPIVVLRGPDLSMEKREAGLRELPGFIGQILDLHPGDKGVIHAVTYETAEALAKAFPRRVLRHNPRDRSEVIRRFKESSEPLVLVSPSIERGEDFPDDICRFIIVAKLPFPYLGDERIKRRLYQRDGQTWYALRTISKVIQMTGRGMRHESDSCVTYIIDPRFRRVYQENMRMFPQWWKEAIVWEDLGKEVKPSGSSEGSKTQQGDQGGNPPKERIREALEEAGGGSSSVGGRGPGHSQSGEDAGDDALPSKPGISGSRRLDRRHERESARQSQHPHQGG